MEKKNEGQAINTKTIEMLEARARGGSINKRPQMARAGV